MRDKSGRFVNVYSNNAGGRPKDESKIDKHIQDSPESNGIKAPLTFLSSIGINVWVIFGKIHPKNAKIDQLGVNRNRRLLCVLCGFSGCWVRI